MGKENKADMRKYTFICFASTILLASSVVLTDMVARAEANDFSGSGHVQFEGKHPKQINDPERPGKAVDPSESPSTEQNLRFDFVPNLNFGEAIISKEDQTFYGNAQLFKDDTGPRGNFIQVSDFRDKSTGWLLQLKQETQLRDTKDPAKELKGAVLSFDHSWTNSLNDPKTSPTVSKEVIRILNVGELYNLAEAKPNNGEGTWSISFGASIDNDKQQQDTLQPRLNPEGNVLTDPQFNDQPIYENKAVSLFIPGKANAEPGNYQTVLTWILSELP